MKRVESVVGTSARGERGMRRGEERAGAADRAHMRGITQGMVSQTSWGIVAIEQLRKGFGQCAGEGIHALVGAEG